ncbi:helix-turn-helix transcriptional regulator [Shimia thalassica]|uniref:helix-turn-helix domain-containing protein n=1 Tax=Shimia thalassica TaxID=1715693 RepID=UPI000C07F30F|nr:helix-turn-helix transcriptional regulator [Shimia thalassica]PHO02313.1 transcriptional regulator [Rhodobacteraceae bacterium 4F10]MBU2943983.1 helix-turn-helix domain-containing protein [Shimia thalassica]MDO6480362.1 helix-turn-helix transcriptional regulator [Shimia thalassica]MDO6483423.1 helix-turn-helix transcriptional regulator [Shimia thalassica]MDO6503494.1 helix-turn-helix transcriptional regulator [Shimia thalassica]
MADNFTDEDYQDYWYGEDVATFGDRLAAARRYAEMSQGQFAKRLGVKLSTVRSWEDDFSEPRANKLQMMAGLLNVSVVWLLMGEGEGVSTAPGDEEAELSDLSGLLLEVRDIRTQMKNNLDQLARLEKRLRQKVYEATPNE